MGTLTTLLCTLFLFSPVPLAGLEEYLVLGTEDEWRSLSLTQGVRLVPGVRGFPDLVLEDSEYRVAADTDLLMHFNIPVPVEETTRYRVPADTPVRITTGHARLGAGAAVFDTGTGGLEVTPEAGSILFPGTLIDTDFSIEFLLYPAALEDGEIVLAWRGARLRGSTLQPQEMSCSVRNRSLVWSFRNFFLSPEGDDFTVSLDSGPGLIPREWRHHLLRFDSESGLLEYLVDGVPEVIRYATGSGRESAVVYLPRIGSASPQPLSLAPSFTGFLDELRITTSFVTEPVLSRFERSVGRAVTELLDLGYTNSALRSVDAAVDTPADTAVFFEYRIGDTADGPASLPLEWHPFLPGSPFPPEAKGRYLQLRMELHPDGSGTHTPVVSHITVAWEPDLPPAAPSRLSAVAMDGAVTLSWSEVPEADIAGYLLYYGERPGRYFGGDASGGPSPLDAGRRTSYTVEGLVNGRLYYFSVAAYDSADIRKIGAFSREVSARPSRVYR